MPTRARRLYLTLSNGDFELVMDDEKYFLLHNESIAASHGFYTSDPNTAPPEVKFKSTQKFWSGLQYLKVASQHHSSPSNNKLLLKRRT